MRSLQTDTDELEVLDVLERINQPAIWDEEPVFCFTTDIDWAPEAAIEHVLATFSNGPSRLTAFVTHESGLLTDYHQRDIIDIGIHPNFLPGSSHGSSFDEVIRSCAAFAPPSAIAIRSHKLFDVTDVTYSLYEQYGFRIISNLGTIMQKGIRPLLHGSGLLHVPIFFEDGTHLYRKITLDFSKIRQHFYTPGIKVISLHPFDYALNTPRIEHSRILKDSITREQYGLMSEEELEEHRHRGRGVRDLVDEIVRLASDRCTMSLEEIYRTALRSESRVAEP